MSEESKQSDKAEAKEPKAKKPPEYRRFEEILKKVIKAPPLRKAKIEPLFTVEVQRIFQLDHLNVCPDVSVHLHPYSLKCFGHSHLIWS